MRLLVTVSLIGAALAGCISYKTLRGSSGNYLTPAGARVTLNRQASDISQAVQQLFAERGFQLVNRAQPTPQSQVLFFKGSRALVTTQNNTADTTWSAGGQLGSWFAVRVVEDGYHCSVQFYGKPTVGGQEVCADGDDQLRDAQYQCVDTKVREDWPGFQLVEGREETQVITSVIATLTERVPEK
jgi:hypothetical protein